MIVAGVLVYGVYSYWPRIEARFFTDDGLVVQSELCHVTVDRGWVEVESRNWGPEVQFGCDHEPRKIELVVSAFPKAAPGAATTLREAEERYALELNERVGTFQLLKGPRNVRSLRQTGLERVVRYMEEGRDTTAILAAYQSARYYFRVFCWCPSDRWGENKEAMHAATRSFQLGESEEDGRDPSEGWDDGTSSGVPAVQPRFTPREHEEFLERLQANTNTDERVVMLKDWQARRVHDQVGDWRDLVHALAGGPTDDQIDAIVIRELRRSPVTIREQVECLPKASPGVRRALIDLLTKSPQADREVFVELLKDSPSQDSPGVLEALLVLGEVTPERVRELVALEGLGVAKHDGLRAQLVARARAEPAFLAALLADSSAKVRVCGCRLTARADRGGDGPLSLLVPVLRDDDPWVRREAAKALGQLGNPRATWALARHVAGERDAKARAQSLRALESFDPERTRALLLSLGERGTDDRRAALIAFRVLPAQAALEPLRAALGSSNPALLFAALETLIALCEGGGAKALAPCKPRVRRLNVFSDPKLANLKVAALDALGG